MLKFKEFIKPNFSKIVILLILIVTFYLSYLYLLSIGMCQRNCPEINVVITTLTLPIVVPSTLIYNKVDTLGTYLFYKEERRGLTESRIEHIPEDLKEDYRLQNSYVVVVPRFHEFISYYGVMLFDILAVIFNLMYAYILASLMYLVYKDVKNKLHRK